MRNNFIIHIAYIAIIIVVFLILHLMYTGTKTSVVFNIKTTYTAFLRQASSHKLSKAEIVMLGQAFPRAVALAVNSYAKKHHVVVLAQNAVVAGAKDVTKNIQALIGENMKKLARNKDK